MDKQKKISSIKLGELINKLRTDKMKKSKTFEEKKKFGLRGFAEWITVINNKGIKKKMSHANLSHIENGDVWTTKDILKQIADNLEYPFDKILAIRNEVNSDIENIIIEQSESVPEFLRTAKNLTAEEWKKLTEQIKSKDNKNG